MPRSVSRSQFPANAFSLSLAVLLLLIIGTGCGIPERFRAESNRTDPPNSNVNAGTPDTDSSAASEEAKTSVAGPCANEYYPVDTNLVRRYEVTGSEPAKYTLTQKDVSEAGFKEDRAFDSDLLVTNNWVCTADGLRAAEFTNTGVMRSGRFEMETVKSTGLTIPHALEAGKTFDSHYDIRVKVKAGSVSADATGNVKVSNKVVSVAELIEVNGKQFESARIDSNLEIVVTVNGRRIESANITTSNWYGKGAGLVKQETGGKFGRAMLHLTSIEK